MENRIIIIDGNSLINRAYYAMQKPMITKDGLYTQGVYGFLNMLNKIKTDYESGYIVVTFDRKAPTFRHEKFADYKAGRKKMPAELAMQLPLLKEVLQAMNIKMLEIDGFEADDIIGTIAREAEEKGLEPFIISGDKDELQLATKKTRVLITKKGISEFEIYDEDAMMDKYGFTPTQFIDYKALMGDQSDNIPGLPGVGEKTAMKLIHEFGSIENLIANSKDVTSERLRTNIEENAQLAIMSKILATINLNVPIEINFEEFYNEEPDYDELINVYIKLEFNSFLKRLKIPDLENAGGGLRKFNKESANPIIITTTEQLTELIDEKETILKVFTDNDHKDIPIIEGISFTNEKGNFYIKGPDENLIKIFLTLLIKKKSKIVGHYLIKDYYTLLTRVDSEMKDAGFESLFNTSFDTALAQYVLDVSRSNYEIKTLIFEYFHEEMESESDFLKTIGQIDLFKDSSESFAAYGNKLCQAVLNLKNVLEEKIKNENLEQILYKVELPLVEVLASMEANGFATDRQELLNIGEELSRRLELLTETIHTLSGEIFNINSPAQLGVVLFEKLGLTTGKKTKTGYSTGVEVLEKLIDKHAIIQPILDFRMLSKLKSTYVEGLLPLINKDHKIHPHFQQTVAATGRISCTEPNLQNIPIKQEYGRRIRKAFVTSGPDYSLVGADYSQIELRVLAHLSEDPLLIEAFNNGDDIHKITASKVFGIPEEEVTSLQRNNAKVVNFGVIYGMSGFGLSTELKIPRKEAEKYIDEYFKKYEKVKIYMDGLIEMAKTKGYVTTILNRKRTINEINASNYMVRQSGERLAMNSPIQGSAADIIKLAMIKVYAELTKNNTKSKLILQVHDELIIEAHCDELDAMKDLIEKAMESAMDLKVKLAVDVNCGNNWYDLK